MRFGGIYEHLRKVKCFYSVHDRTMIQAMPSSSAAADWIRCIRA